MIPFLARDGLLYSGSYDRTIRCWRISDGICVRIFSVRPIRSSLHAAVIQETRRDDRGSPSQGHTNAIRALALSRDGQTLYSGSRDNTIRVWRTRDGMQLRVIEGHSSYVQVPHHLIFPSSSLRSF